MMTDRDLTRAEVEALRDGTTPGPLFVVRGTEPPRLWIVQDPETWVHRTAAIPLYGDRIHEQEANARLYAAAPTLAAQLLRCMDERREAVMQSLADLGQAQEAYEAQLAAEAENARLREAWCKAKPGAQAEKGETMTDDDLIRREKAFMVAVWEALKADASDLGKQQRILTAFRAFAASPPLPATPIYTAADLEAACRVGLEMAQQVTRDEIDLARVACKTTAKVLAIVHGNIFALTPPADLAERVKGGGK